MDGGRLLSTLLSFMLPISVLQGSPRSGKILFPQGQGKKISSRSGKILFPQGQGKFYFLKVMEKSENFEIGQ